MNFELCISKFKHAQKMYIQIYVRNQKPGFKRKGHVDTML